MTQVLPSWRDGEAKRAIMRFLDAACAEGSPDYVDPPDRIAVFDLDGTLWCEKPEFAHASFVIDQLRAKSAERSELADDPIVRALTAGDLGEAVRAGGIDGVMQALGELHAGITAEDFARRATAWFGSAVHPDFGVPYPHLVYQPMLELIDLLRANQFRVFVVTGSGVEFVRSVSEDLYGVRPDDVVGTSVEVALERIDGVLQLVRQPRFRGSPNEGAPKAVNIQAHVGKRPIFAAGNTAGDREMLEYTQTSSAATLSIVINHDDDVREYSYVGASTTDPGAEPVVQTAKRLGWPVVSMRDDWLAIFPEGVLN